MDFECQLGCVLRKNHTHTMDIGSTPNRPPAAQRRQTRSPFLAVPTFSLHNLVLLALSVLPFMNIK